MGTLKRVECLRAIVHRRTRKSLRKAILRLVTVHHAASEVGWVASMQLHWLASLQLHWFAGSYQHCACRSRRCLSALVPLSLVDGWNWRAVTLPCRCQ